MQYSKSADTEIDFKAWREIPKQAQRPPMGWNSWDVYGVDVTEAEVLAVADVMAAKLLPAGYDTVVIDLGWYAPGSTAIGKHYQRANPHQLIDQWGRFLPCPDRFPSARDGKGFKPLADAIHAKGLKFGIHVLRGIPIQAVWENTPIKGTSLHARDIAVPEIRCVFYDGLYGTDCNRPGALEYYRSIFELYAKWGVDFIKADDMTSYPQHYDEVKAFRWALDHCERPMVLSLSPGAVSYFDRSHAAHHGDMYRISGDFWDNWNSLKAMFEKCRMFQGHTGPGHWADCDMIPLGKINVRAETEGGARQSNFTTTEAQTLLSLWAIFRSPLMLGMDLTALDDDLLAMLTNPELIRINQHSVGNREVRFDATSSLWRAESADGESVYAALFNLTDDDQALPISIDEIAAPGTNPIDIWSGEKIARPSSNTLSLEVPAHGVRLLKFA